jgi:hypothetical protein
MASNKADGTKCLKMLIHHHGVDVKSRKSIRMLVVGGYSSAFSMQHGELSLVKHYELKKREILDAFSVQSIIMILCSNLQVT